MVKWKQWLGEKVKPTKTYILVGYDESEHYEDYYKHYQELGLINVKIIPAEKGISIEDAVKNIQPPANIVLDCHGGKDGTFTWNKNDGVPYSCFFAALPRKGIQSIALTSCYGGTALNTVSLKEAPAGTLVLPMASSENKALFKCTLSFVLGSKNIRDPIDLALKVLDGFHPQDYYDEVTASHPEDDPNPEHALPCYIGIGGNPPLAINLRAEVRALTSGRSSTVNAAPINDYTWKRTIKRVQHHFDTTHFQPKAGGGIKWGSHGEDTERALQKQISDIAQRIRSGAPVGKGDDPIKNADELRIAYALAAAYLDESGQIAYARKVQFNNVQSTAIGAAAETHTPEADKSKRER